MRWGLTSNVRTLMIAAPAREIVSKVSCEPLYRPAEVQCPYVDSSSFASKLYLADMARLHTYIRPLKLAYVY
jgi:hypothetical protein